jgi:hypothetical protein
MTKRTIRWASQSRSGTRRPSLKNKAPRHAKDEKLHWPSAYVAKDRIQSRPRKHVNIEVSDLLVTHHDRPRSLTKAHRVFDDFVDGFVDTSRYTTGLYGQFPLMKLSQQLWPIETDTIELATTEKSKEVNAGAFPTTLRPLENN